MQAWIVFMITPGFDIYHLDAKVQVGLVHLEHLSELADELLALVVVGGAHGWRFQA
jgi:hypothetical protein